MAISFLNQSGASDDYVQGAYDNTVFSNPAWFTINCWVYPITVAGTLQAVTLHNTTNDNRWSLGLNSVTGKAVFQAFDTSLASAASTTNYTANAWNMITGVGNFSANRTIYLNGGGSATNTVNKRLTKANTWLLGANYATGAIAPTWEGYIAEFAYWEGTLTEDDINALYKGVKASQVNPNNLKVYFPGIRNYTDLKATTTTITTAGTNLAIVPHVRRYG